MNAQSIHTYRSSRSSGPSPRNVHELHSTPGNDQFTPGAHAQRRLRKLSCVPVSQSVPRHLTSRPINCSTNNTTYSASNKGRKTNGVFSETAAFGSYGVKHERKIQLLIRTGLPRAGPLALCILKAQEVTMKSVYRLPHAIYCCS